MSTYIHKALTKMKRTNNPHTGAGVGCQVLVCCWHSRATPGHQSAACNECGSFASVVPLSIIKQEGYKWFPRTWPALKYSHKYLPNTQSIEGIGTVGTARGVRSSQPSRTKNRKVCTKVSGTETKSLTSLQTRRDS